MKRITLPPHVPEEARGAYMQFTAAQSLLDDLVKREANTTQALNVLGFLCARVLEQIQEPEAVQALSKGLLLTLTQFAQNHLSRLNADPAVQVRVNLPNKPARLSMVQACFDQTVKQDLDDREFMKSAQPILEN